MNSDHHRRAKEIFFRACALDGSAQAAFLEEACGDDDALRAEVEGLLDIDRNIEAVGSPLLVGSSAFQPVLGSDPETALPDQLGHYRIHEKLGQGGMGVVYVGEDLKLKRRVALKFLPPTITRTPAILDRFEREAQLLAALNHPNIATIHSLEEFDGHRFLTLELIPGATLAHRLAERPLGVPEAVAIGRQIAIALEAAHAEGIVHRDLKPANIQLIPDGPVKVLDFGIAAALSDLEGGGEGRRLKLGTPGYMSPEQIRGDRVDERTDTWALGCVLFECLTGKPAFSETTRAELERATLNGEPMWDELPIDLPARLRELVKSCLAKEIDHRPHPMTTIRRLLDDEEAHHTSLPRANTIRSQDQPGNLPRSLDDFIGRRREVEELQERIDGHRLVSITGTGGCGKSRLALEVAARLAAEQPMRFDGGVWLVELASVRDPEQIGQTVARALGLPEVPGRSATEALVKSLAEEPRLLIIDNCEHLIDGAAAAIDHWLKHCPPVSILCTSRERLGINGEAVIALEPLSVSTTTDDPSAHHCEAVALFEARASAVGTTLQPSDRSRVAEICRRLDGLPLAIELAAARLRMLSLKALGKHLDDRFRLLKGGDRSAPAHQQTLETTIAWSFDLLDEEQRLLLSRVAVFPAGFSLESAEEVCCDERLDGLAQLDGLALFDGIASLVDRSLITLDTEASEKFGFMRYRLLESVREFARSRANSEDIFDSRLYDYLLELARQNCPLLLGPDRAEARARLAVEHDNFESILTGSFAGTSPRRALALAVQLSRYWSTGAHWSTGRRILEALVTAAEQAEPEPLDAGAQLALGQLRLAQGELDHTKTTLETALKLARATDNDEVERKTLYTLGVVARRRGDYDEAQDLLDQQCRLERQRGETQNLASVLNALGHLAGSREDHEQARAHYEEALGINRRLENRQWMSINLGGLGLVAHATGDLSAALTYFEEALQIERELDDQRGAAGTLHNLGSVVRDLGDRDRARSLTEQAMAINRATENRAWIGHNLLHLGYVAQDDDQLEEAMEHYHSAFELFRELGIQVGVVNCLNSASEIASRRGHATRATQLLAAAEALRTTLGHPLSDQEQQDRDARVAELEETLGRDEYEQQWRAGRELENDAAAALIEEEARADRRED